MNNQVLVESKGKSGNHGTSRKGIKLNLIPCGLQPSCIQDHQVVGHASHLGTEFLQHYLDSA